MRALLVFLALAGFSAPAAAFSDSDRAAVQGAIEQQLQAFLHDDATAAYSFAAPSIRAMFPSQDIFMQMVAKAYPQVYRPRSHQFQGLEEKPGHLEQMVSIVDGGGVYWNALYLLEQQPDGSWKITGCIIEKAPGVGA